MIVDLAAATAGACGGKAAALGRLLRAGARVPPGLVLPFDAHRDAARGHPPGTAPPVPPRWVAALAAGLAALGDPPVAVRSSAADEDTAGASAAGQHDTVLGVRGADAVARAVRTCWASLWSPRARAYRAARGPAGDPAMAVIVQRLVDADVAGVLFTGDPVRIEASWGLGESVVQGRVTPDAWTVPAGGPPRCATGDKRTRVDRGPAGAVTSAVPAADRRRPCLDDDLVRRLVSTGRQVADLFGGAPADIEWALAGDDLWLVQARPATAPPPAAAPAPDPAATLTGVPGSAGTATGPARAISGPGDFGSVRPGDVIVCPATDPAWTPLFGIAAAVVTETGGVLSHAAIVAREHGIPAVLGAPAARAVLRDAGAVVVDGDAGTVTRARPAPGG